MKSAVYSKPHRMNMLYGEAYAPAAEQSSKETQSIKWASSRENLSSGFPTRYYSNRPAQLQSICAV